MRAIVSIEYPYKYPRMPQVSLDEGSRSAYVWPAIAPFPSGALPKDALSPGCALKVVESGKFDRGMPLYSSVTGLAISGDVLQKERPTEAILFGVKTMDVWYHHIPFRYYLGWHELQGTVSLGGRPYWARTLMGYRDPFIAHNGKIYYFNFIFVGRPLDGTERKPADAPIDKPFSY